MLSVCVEYPMRMMTTVANVLSQTTQPHPVEKTRDKAQPYMHHPHCLPNFVSRNPLLLRCLA
ncbi:hypothetical protein BC835DRAFT_1400241 [Cytidiella melzeri]|nr:hypothetical protein BC835DRAFT_1400241 [Cytidiella melzeri]